MTEGTTMKSIDRLCEWANGLHGVYINPVDHTITVTTGWDAPPDMDSVSLRDHINGILDGIEREVEDMVPMPVDADGVPIRVGDAVTCGATVWTVTGLKFLGEGWGICCTVYNEYSGSGTSVYPPSDLHHHHAPTVEDVLREFADEVQRCCDTSDTIAEYAARLRLAGDE